MQRKLIVVGGPTGIGKTDVSIILALALDAEIISFDSRQFFIETQIGTAKPTIDQLKKVKHHFINSHHVWQPFTAGAFAQTCNKLISENPSQNFVLVGGSGMYIDAWLHKLDDLPLMDATYRKQLDVWYENNGIAFLQAMLKQADPTYYYTVDLFNKQRVMRALEVCHLGNKPYSAYLAGKEKNVMEVIKLGLNMPRQQLYNRINCRVDSMIAAGLVNECKLLLPYKEMQALKTVGYKEMF
ncbi:MAG TPA: tRNA (adenosine(37)-N6)-dimethylallyltransferase MiaA, partial [Bacteroidia bacterium]|nr:tRNA (adenosine(37)-N6)-dimethylallyltransferase MiaA [Bacteroidia bacterium]